MFKIFTADDFNQEYKRLLKKYPSLKDDLVEFQEYLIENPLNGTPLGNGLHKHRLKISSKKTGKSGGARIITYVLKLDLEIYLLTMYDKSEISNISIEYLKQLISNLPK